MLVIDQGTMLDRIDYNVEQVVTQAKSANKELTKAKEAAKSGRAIKCIICNGFNRIFIQAQRCERGEGRKQGRGDRGDVV